MRYFGFCLGLAPFTLLFRRAMGQTLRYFRLLPGTHYENRKRFINNAGHEFHFLTLLASDELSMLYTELK